ncbi:MAG: glycosyltransferase [Bacteroidota bacterium]
MNIAVNTRALSKKDIPKTFIEEIFIDLSKEKTNDNFIFFSDLKTISNPIAVKLWQNLQLPALLKKGKADILVNARVAGEIKTGIPQIQFIDGLSALIKLNKTIADTFQKAQRIIATTELAKKNLIERYKIDELKIDVIHLAAKKYFIPIDWNEKQKILETRFNEKEYFLFVAETYHEEELVNVLKAFSLFKKWQKSNMQLVIACKAESLPESFTKSLRLYKYKDEVILQDFRDEELSKTYAAAYCFIHPAVKINYTDILQAMQSNVPVITTSNEITEEICNDSVLSVSINDPVQLSKNMILIYKDEELRNELVSKGAAQASQYKYPETLEKLSLSIEKALQG